MHHIKPLTSLTREQRREQAQAAAINGEPLHEANPYPPGTQEHQDFQDDYVAYRLALESERA